MTELTDIKVKLNKNKRSDKIKKLEELNKSLNLSMATNDLTKISILLVEIGNILEELTKDMPNE